MLPAVITALLPVVMLLIITGLIFSAWRAHRQHQRKVAAQSHLPAHPMDRHVTAILYLQEGTIVTVEKPEPVPAFSLPPSWYTRRRMLVSIGLLVMILLAFFVQSGL